MISRAWYGACVSISVVERPMKDMASTAHPGRKRVRILRYSPIGPRRTLPKYRATGFGCACWRWMGVRFAALRASMVCWSLFRIAGRSSEAIATWAQVFLGWLPCVASGCCGSGSFAPRRGVSRAALLGPAAGLVCGVAFAGEAVVLGWGGAAFLRACCCWMAGWCGEW